MKARMHPCNAGTEAPPGSRGRVSWVERGGEMSVDRAKLTAEEFWALHLEGAELVNGEVVELMPALPQHGQIAGALVIPDSKR